MRRLLRPGARPPPITSTTCRPRAACAAAPTRPELPRRLVARSQGQTNSLLTGVPLQIRQFWRRTVYSLRLGMSFRDLKRPAGLYIHDRSVAERLLQPDGESVGAC